MSLFKIDRYQRTINVAVLRRGSSTSDPKRRLGIGTLDLEPNLGCPLNSSEKALESIQL